MTRIPESRRDPLLALLLFATALAVYLRTLCPTLYWGDCGELASVVATGGIPHPTGYPLYCLLGKAWTLLLPVGTIVWRLNVLSAVFGAGAVACLYGFCRALSLPRILALTAGGMLAFSFTFWQQCLLTETYTLAALFSCLNLFLAARWRARGCRPADLTRLAVSYGFTLTCHQTNTLFLPGFLLFVFWTEPTLLRLREAATRRQWGVTLGLGMLPLLTYIYLPLRARTHPLYNWGDPETPFLFFYHVTGRAYANGMFHGSRHEFGLRLAEWAMHLRVEFAPPLIALAALGLALFWRRSETRPLAALLSWMFLADLIFVTNYSIYNGYIYYIPGYVVLSASAARGLWGLWEALQPRLEPAKRPGYALFAGLCALLLVPTQFAAHRHVDLSQNWTCYDLGRNLLASVPPGGILVESGDDTPACAVTYLQLVEGRRTDVVLVRRGIMAGAYDTAYNQWVNVWYFDTLKRSYPGMAHLYPNHALSVRQALTEDPLRRLIRYAVSHGTPVCALAPAGVPSWMAAMNPMADDDGKMVGLDVYLSRHYDPTQVGLVTRIYPRGQRPAGPALYAETERVWRSYSLRGVFQGGQLQDDRFLGLLAVDYANAALARAHAAFRQGDYATAEDSYQSVLALFTCDEATQGIARCRQARRSPARQVAAR